MTKHIMIYGEKENYYVEHAVIDYTIYVTVYTGLTYAHNYVGEGHTQTRITMVTLQQINTSTQVCIIKYNNFCR